MSAKERLASSRLKLDWDEGRTERLLTSVHQRLQRRRRAWRAAALAVTATLASAVGILVIAPWGRIDKSALSSHSNDAKSRLDALNAIHLADGSEIELDPATSEVRIADASDSHIRVEVVRGSSRYSVVPNPDRTFEVRCGPVVVTVVGTEFIVEQRGEAAWVEVLRGKVRVSWGDERASLEAGESGTFPREKRDRAAEDGLAVSGEIDAKAARSPHATQLYRARVAKRDYGGAYAVLSRNPALAGDTVEDLLVAADVARLSNHPAEAVPYLQRIIREHPRDERAPLAAFTLGRTLGGLGRTEEAMNMFGRVHGTWPKSPLAEDALLRQAEAASQLGDLDAARRIAEQYDRDYPNGRRRAEVRRFARLP